MKTIKIGLIGLGTVGSAIVRGLISQAAVFESMGYDYQIVAIAVRDVTKKRDCPYDPKLLTTDVSHIVNHPDIDVVIEAAGGVEPMATWLLRAVANRKHVVTANKSLIAERGHELLSAAKANQVWVGYEASCAGEIPIIKHLRSKHFDLPIYNMRGIVNGTTNFILTMMEEKRVSYEDALATAQKLGFAEADPSADVDGLDAAAKLLIMTRLGFQLYTQAQQVTCHGITGISAEDIRLIAERDCRIKLVAEGARHAEGQVSLSVRPVILPADARFAQVVGPENIISVDDKVIITGQGAGGEVTARAILQDLDDVSRGPTAEMIRTQTVGFTPTEDKTAYVSCDTAVESYYVNLTLDKMPLTDFATHLDKQGLTFALLDVSKSVQLLFENISYARLTAALTVMQVAAMISSFHLLAVDPAAKRLLAEVRHEQAPSQSWLKFFSCFCQGSGDDPSPKSGHGAVYRRM